MVSKPDTGRCASEEAEPRRGGGHEARRLSPEGGGREAVCQQGRWASKGVDWRVLHLLEKGTSANKDARLGRRVDCEIPHRLERRTKHFL